MRIRKIMLLMICIAACFSFNNNNTSVYYDFYTEELESFITQQNVLIATIRSSNPENAEDKKTIKAQIEQTRLKLKENDFWLRYFEPVQYKKINAPIPVEWENEVFEKFEKPYRRQGAGITLAELYLNEKSVNKDSLIALIQSSIESTKAFQADSITDNLKTHDHFFLANRLYLLNLASIYNTGFECPDTENIIPELRYMLSHIKKLYENYNESFPSEPLSSQYFDLYNKTIAFVEKQPSDYSLFDHFTFIQKYINPLFRMNQQFIKDYSVSSINYNDYTLNDDCLSIFDKSLFTAQNIKGIYSAVEDEEVLEKIKQTGKLLFYDPILSGNNKRSCASCHRTNEYFTDTSVETSLQFNKEGSLQRNSISLINAVYNHLLMADGSRLTLQDQAHAVLMNPQEMNSSENELLSKVLSCEEYKSAFKKYLKLTPEEKKITLTHITSAITLYYGGFSKYYSSFDEAMTKNELLDNASIKGFNLFMSKAQCATCHFVPAFNGVKPPFISSEFEVIGVPEDLHFTTLSKDSGRYDVNPAAETFHAFRTGTIRNAEHTKPYMHNGVFKTLNEVLDFYDAGGGEGKKLSVSNQTLPADSLKLSKEEKAELLAFIHSLNEKIVFDKIPEKLPTSSDKNLNNRKPGGEY